MSDLPRVEVVVCTRNRARLLAAACEAILGQDYPAERWRLLVVDNLSTDDTFAVASGLADRFPGRLRAVRHEELGHSSSRNAGIAASDAEIVAFTDDDALPDPGWLSSLVAVMAAQRALVAGGPVDLQLAGELPPWFLSPFLLYLAIWRRPGGVAPLVYNDYPRGVNMAFRREAFERFGGFSRRLGLRGRRQLFCEETELCLRIERNGGRIVYSPDSRVRHCVEARRFTPDWLSGRFRAQGRSEARLNWMHAGLRGLWRGSRVHRVNWRAWTPQSVAAHGIAVDGNGEVAGAAAVADPVAAAAVLTRCLRRALLGYLREIPVAVATVPRYRPAAGQRPARFEPL